MLFKLYKLDGRKKMYWETWENNKIHTVHWGELGTRGEREEFRGLIKGMLPKRIQKEMRKLEDKGYRELRDEEQQIVLIEFQIDGFGSEADLEKRYRLQDRMDETLGWTGLGNCDGGSSGSGTMEVCSFVVDFEIAKQVIEKDLKGTEFEDYSRIYLEE